MKDLTHFQLTFLLITYVIYALIFFIFVTDFSRIIGITFGIIHTIVAIIFLITLFNRVK
jgi:uncharacterized membrane protein required for colicin V production